MSVHRWLTSLAAFVLAGIVVLGPAAGLDGKAPKIVAASMIDANGDFRADRVRLTYSEPVRHASDRDGHYPFSVAGYRIRFVGLAHGRTLFVFLAEKAQPDQTARPAIRYRPTRSKAVRDRRGTQAIIQSFSQVRAHGHAPPATSVSSAPPASAPSPAPSPAPAASDSDHDGTPDARDCAPHDASIHPAAPDLPDLSFVDSNCDGIDGTEADAIFVAPTGNDANPGTKTRPKREIQAALATAAAAGNGRYVLAAAGSYSHVTAATGIGVYGGYDAGNWSRRSSSPKTSITGVPEGLLAVNAAGVVLQLLEIHGASNGIASPNAFGIRALGSDLTLQRVSVTAGAGAFRGAGQDGVPGADGGVGEVGRPGECDAFTGNEGGAGGASPAGRVGGHGGRGGEPGLIAGPHSDPATPGEFGQSGTPGGGAGTNGDPGGPGGRGAYGAPGALGTGGLGGKSDALQAFTQWAGENGAAGGSGQPGNGGGGGGGGGAQVAFQLGTEYYGGAGNGGGGGGGGGAAGGGGQGGSWGGGSFGIYILNSKVTLEASSITAGGGAPGGSGGIGARGGRGGAGGAGGTECISEVGPGGIGGGGGPGGQGGGGGGGAGGPSIGIFELGTATTKVHDSTIKAGTPGAGGLGGGPGSLSGQNGEPGIAAETYRKP